MNNKSSSYISRLEESIDILRMAMILNDMSVIKPEHLSICLSVLDRELFVLEEALNEQSEDTGNS